MKLYDIVAADGEFVESLTQREIMNKFGLTKCRFRTFLDNSYLIDGKYWIDDSAEDMQVTRNGCRKMLKQFDALTENITPTLGALTVNSVAGSATGDTKITVNPTKENANNVYKYKVAAEAVTVGYGQNLRNWSTWDGKADIKAATGQKITVVECDGTYKALNVGSASVTAK